MADHLRKRKVLNLSVPYADRHGLLWLSHGEIFVLEGAIVFKAKETDVLPKGVLQLPHQNLSMVLLGPGTSITHDAFRVLGKSGTSISVVGEDGVKLYTAPPILQTRSEVARTHARLWANERSRLNVARRMYAKRLGRILPHRDLDVLRGIEGAYMREVYASSAKQYGIQWNGRDYDHTNPSTADQANLAVSMAASHVYHAANIAVTATGAIPALGFIHESSGIAFSLDIADIYRADFTIPLAFQVLQRTAGDGNLEASIRKECGRQFKKTELIDRMIDVIKELIQDDGK